MATDDNTGGVTIRRYSSDMYTVKIGDTVRCTDGMRFHGREGIVTAFVHDGNRHPVTVVLPKADGQPGKRTARFYRWEKIASAP